VAFAVAVGLAFAGLAVLERSEREFVDRYPTAGMLECPAPEKTAAERAAAAGRAAAEHAAAEKAAAERAVRLGDGYRNAKWGMSVAETKRLLGGEVVQESESSLEIKTTEGQSITCRFWGGGLASVVLNPKQDEDDFDGFYAIEKLLEEKFGSSQNHYSFTDTPQEVEKSKGARLDVYPWEDETTIIQLWRISPTYPRILLPPGVTYRAEILYRSKAAMRAKEKAEAEQEEDTKRKELEKARKEMGGNL
jgi:hypothetical protein